ncbi:MAG: sugar transferase [Lachnospiraceae bacterium]|jgi:lipopolysaccharide/colanic/teichoic acid biosynthesis glycosyltransferase|nr:sugar transferase [Lachnospiraceae bacterium]
MRGKSNVFKEEQYTDKQLKRKVNGIYNRYVKRGIDLCLAVPFFVILLPVYLIISAVIIAEDGFPVLYRAYRGGYKNTKFRICKFRSMVKNADKIGGATTALHDPRITGAGVFLRKTKLDETPQLINIIKGEMSFIGPRPEVLEYVSQFKGKEKYILQVRPGITDYSSIEFINLDEIVGSRNADEVFEKEVLWKKNALRVKYVADISFLTDVKIFFRTIRMVLKKAVAR